MATVQGPGGADEGRWRKDRGWEYRQCRQGGGINGHVDGSAGEGSRWQGRDKYLASPLQSRGQFIAGSTPGHGSPLSVLEMF